jgi:hypothetical protein
MASDNIGDHDSVCPAEWSPAAAVTTARAMKERHGPDAAHIARGFISAYWPDTWGRKHWTSITALLDGTTREADVLAEAAPARGWCKDGTLNVDVWKHGRPTIITMADVVVKKHAALPVLVNVAEAARDGVAGAQEFAAGVVATLQAAEDRAFLGFDPAPGPDHTAVMVRPAPDVIVVKAEVIQDVKAALPPAKEPEQGDLF